MSLDHAILPESKEFQVESRQLQQLNVERVNLVEKGKSKKVWLNNGLNNEWMDAWIWLKIWWKNFEF